MLRHPLPCGASPLRRACPPRLMPAPRRLTRTCPMLLSGDASLGWTKLVSFITLGRMLTHESDLSFVNSLLATFPWLRKVEVAFSPHGCTVTFVLTKVPFASPGLFAVFEEVANLTLFPRGSSTPGPHDLWVAAAGDTGWERQFEITSTEQDRDWHFLSTGFYLAEAGEAPRQGD